jgi:peptidoglycan/xylan/chitin deacetylase (PgdA/CDA1 family)
MNPATFEKLIKLFLKNAEIVSINNIYKENFIKSNKFILTFDDGYKDFLIYAFPIIKKYNLEVNLNICPKLVSNSSIPWTQKINILLNRENKKLKNLLEKFSIEYKNHKVNSKIFNFICNEIHNLDSKEYKKFINNLNKIPLSTKNILLNWKEIIYCSNNGIIIGNHSNSHLNINKLNNKELDFEIYKSKKYIKNVIDKDAYIFSIPNGKINKKSLNYISCSHKIILFSDENNNLVIHNKNYIGLNRINISINDPYEEFFRAFGFHLYIKHYLNIFLFQKEQ